MPKGIRKTMPYLPVGPLFKFACDTTDVQSRAVKLHVERATIMRWQRSGMIRLDVADRVCCKALAVHPANVWPDWYTHAR